MPSLHIIRVAVEWLYWDLFCFRRVWGFDWFRMERCISTRSSSVTKG